MLSFRQQTRTPIHQLIILHILECNVKLAGQSSLIKWMCMSVAMCMSVDKQLGIVMLQAS